MTVRQDTFTTLATPPWVEVKPSGDLSILNGLLFSSAAGNYVVYAIDAVAFTHAGVTVTLAEDHGYGAGETFAVALTDGTTITHHIGTRTGATTFTVAPVTAFAAGTAYLNKKTTALSGSNQDISVLALATAEGALNAVTIWAKFDPRGGPATPVSALRAGYGLTLFWGTGGTRTLALTKVNPTDGTFEALASTTAVTTFKDANNSDLNGTQKIRLIVTDEPKVGGEPAGIRLRGYVNEDDLNGPTIEYVDRGYVGTPPHTANGTWAIAFSAATVVLVAAFDGTDQFVSFASGSEQVAKRRTRLELRNLVKDELARGPVNNFDDDLIDQRLLDGLSEIDDFFGDQAVWKNRVETMNLTRDSETLAVTMPYEVERIFGIWSGDAGKFPQPWRLLGIDPEERLLINMDYMPVNGSYVVSYRLRSTQLLADTDLCPVPKRWDELVRLAAITRMVDMRRDPEYGAAMQLRLATRKREVMSFIRRNYGRMEAHQMTITEGPSAPMFTVGAPWQQWGPF